ncbi:c-type cytochrome [Glaciimonas immobilis]|uniref:Cytochrome c553 n=1 Tax=Glaciimonas immobilis TaxID=728004 RepID=A0A840RPC1_9BURK|nr:cytochrome c [Glaciimonas immobilis]KAF3999316.1 cytochrome c [Glaciimonas immobilis]MBB5198798.1 cytochrome c553 [Glaciimonas immobilis]
MKKFVTSVLFLLSATASVSALASGNIAAGEAAVKKYACASCHGANLQSPIQPTYPKIAGQHQDYVAHALIAYQRGAAGPNGRTNPIMGGIAKALTHQDVQDIAAYVHSLPTSLVLEK